VRLFLEINFTPLERDGGADNPTIGDFFAPVKRKTHNVRHTGQVCLRTSTPNGAKDKPMNKYLVSYDLDKPGQDYSRLTNELKRLGGIRILYSEWILRNKASAEAMRNHLKSFIDGNDMLLVVGLTGEAAWTGLMVSTDAFKQAIAA